MSKVDISNWQEFNISDIFRMNNTKSIVQKQISPDSGDIPYVTARATNNGVLTYIDCPIDWTDEGDCILIGGKTLAFTYQENDFVSNDSHNIALHLLDKSHASEKVYLYLITVLHKALYQKYKWLDSISMKTIKKDTFYLPVTEAGDPDWEYMEDYMTEIMQTSKAMLTWANGLIDYDEPDDAETN